MIFFYIFAVVIMLSSLLLARSGGGMLAITASSLLFIGMLWRRKRLRKLTWVVLPVLVVTFAMLVWVGIQPVVEEFSANIDIENPGNRLPKISNLLLNPLPLALNAIPKALNNRLTHSIKLSG